MTWLNCVTFHSVSVSSLICAQIQRLWIARFYNPQGDGQIQSYASESFFGGVKGESWLLYGNCKKRGGGGGEIMHLCIFTLVHFCWGKIAAEFKTIQVKEG